MKRLFAIWCSLMLVWMQAVLAAQAPVNGITGAVCTCCDCGGTDCCVTPSSSAPTPTPTTPARAGVQNEVSFFAPASVARTLPLTEAHISSPAASSSLIATGVPLFTRHCALLI